jgi:hypothetical protein
LPRGLAAVCLLIMGWVLVVRAQGNGVITGKVLDSAGAAIPGAAVSLTDLATQKVVRTTTGQDGQYTFGLPSNPQLVLIEKSGFQSFTQRVSLATRASVTVNATLTVATLAQSVVVRGTVVPEAELGHRSGGYSRGIGDVVRPSFAGSRRADIQGQGCASR